MKNSLINLSVVGILSASLVSFTACASFTGNSCCDGSNACTCGNLCGCNDCACKGAEGRWAIQKPGAFWLGIFKDRKTGEVTASLLWGGGSPNPQQNVKLAGTLDIREYGKIQTGVAYPVVFYHPGKRLNDSKFDYVKVNGAVAKGYKVEYDVEQPDGSYAVTVTKKSGGCWIIVR